MLMRSFLAVNSTLQGSIGWSTLRDRVGWSTLWGSVCTIPRDGGQGALQGIISQ